ncbi:MAG: type I DNA topoisomerase [Flavobacteriales bacterium]|nr:type I DNA topoisomerase [Flavobacteriales bacterium]
MPKNLVIVESPAKAKTIEGYLGKDFVVRSSYGHVRDLPKSDLAIDVENDFTPVYEVSSDKKKLITELKKLAKDAEIVWLATDEDREGEAISWHLAETLKIDASKTRRIVFSEITKNAILRAIDNPRTVDVNLVNAQQARRVLDRLVGFELSPVLWKKVKPSLSAGRVQSVAVRIIVEREREINNFKATSSFRVIAMFNLERGELKAELPKRFATEEEAMAFLNECLGSSYSIQNLETKPSKKSPASPFTTSTLQQEASRKLGFSVSQTMVVAQRLYESGRITYMRTDSVNLSDLALNQAKEVIGNNYGDEYAQTRKYSSKSKGAQEAHEAIRPTELGLQKIEGDSGEQRLYDLIWKRTIASQMADAKLEKTTATIAISGSSSTLQAKGEVIKFEGFLKVYLEGTDDEDEETTKGMLPPLNIGQELELKHINATERFSQHPPRYTEASLVRKLEELGIGRPSTYAPTISTVQKRGYVVKEARDGRARQYRVLKLENEAISKDTATENTGAERGKLFPTDIGIVVNDFLVDNFEDILDYNFTANVEEEFDSIARGEVAWNEMIRNFYGDFHTNVEETIETSERATGERALGDHPESGKPIIARIGRYGPMIQIGDSEDEDKQFASLLPDQSITNITLEEALDLFKLPRQLGEFEGEAVSAAIGRFGPYVRHNKSFVSIKEDEGDDPYTITLERAIELIKVKREADAKAIIQTWDEEPDIRVLNGRYGPYIKAGKKNVKIPKDKKAEELTLEEVRELVANAPDRPARRRSKK